MLGRLRAHYGTTAHECEMCIVGMLEMAHVPIEEARGRAQSAVKRVEAYEVAMQARLLNLEAERAAERRALTVA